ncbi:MAG: hypothetical protein RID02_09535 [Gracilimonas sp.]
MSVALPILLGNELASQPYFNSIIFGLIIFIVVSLIEILIMLNLKEVERKELIKIERIENEISRILHNVRALFINNRIVNKKGSILNEYFIKKINGLEQELNSVVASGEIEINHEHLYLSDILLDSFNGSSQDFIRIVHRLKYNSELLNVHEKQWLRKVDESVKNKKVKKVSRLFVYENEVELMSEISKKIIAAHSNTRKYEFRVIGATEFERLMSDYGFNNDCIDFGIYSNKTVYKTIEYDEERNLKGIYISKEDSIEKYRNLFEKCWANGHTLENKDLPDININDLLNY